MTEAKIKTLNLTSTFGESISNVTSGLQLYLKRNSNAGIFFMIHLWWLYLAMFRFNAADNSEQGMQKMDVTSQN